MVEEFRKPDEPLLPTATIESNIEERIIYDVEVEVQVTSTFFIPAKVKSIFSKSLKVRLIVIIEQKSWMVSSDLFQQRYIQIALPSAMSRKFTP